MEERTTRPEPCRGWLSCLAALVTLAPAAAPAQPAMSPAAPARPSSPAEPGSKPVSLQEAIQIAQQNQGRIAVAEESVESARQQVRIARVGTLPSVTGSIGYQGTGTSGLGGLFGPNPTQTVPGAAGQPSRNVSVNTDTSTFDRGLQPKIALTYTPFDSGLTRAQVRQARASVESSLGNLASTRNDLSLTVTTDYLAQLRAERLLDLRRVQEELALTQLRQVEARVREGAAAEADRALPLSQYRNTQVDRIQAQNDVRVAAVILRDEMGLPAGPPLQLVELPAEDAPLPPQETLIAIAQRERPEISQAEAQVRVAEAGVSIARIARKPRLTTSFAFNLTPNNEFSRSDYAVGAAISLPIWDAGLTQAQELQAKTQVQSTSAQLEQLRKDVAADVGQAYFNLISARERTEAGRLAVEAAQVNLAQTTARYQRGVAGTTIVELIQAQVQFATANNNLINAIYDSHTARAQLSRAIGKQPTQ